MESANQTHQYFILYKPYGFLSQFVNNQNKRTNKKMLGDLFSFPTGTMAIGRLDEGSEGLLMLTTHGKMSEFVRSNKVEKEYYVQVDGIITPDALEKMKTGIEIGVPSSNSHPEKFIYKTKPCEIFKLNQAPNLPERSKKIRDERHGPTSWVSITIKEGKFRQVRKMTAKVGFPTLRLVRVRIGDFHLGNLKVGEVKKVDSFYNLPP